MDSKKFRGDRLKKARQYRGRTLTDLAEATGITKQSLSLYENGTNPDHERVVKIAQELGFPYDYFMQEDTCRAESGVTYFRSLATATKISRTAESTKLEFVAKVYELLLQYIDFPALNLPQIDFNGSYDEFDDEAEAKMIDEIEGIAQAVRKQWGLGNEPIGNLQLLLEGNGIIVTGFDVDTKIDAFSQRILLDDGQVYLIAVTQGDMPEGRIIFDMAHELGHILMHPWSEELDYVSKEEFKLRERQANMFASALLLPRETFTRDVEAYPTDLAYYQFLKKKWKCSMAAMMYRAHELGIVTDNQFQYMMRQYSKKGYRNGEPDDIPYYLNENMFQGAIDLLFEEKIFTPKTLMAFFKRHSVTLYPKDLEELLHLREGTLHYEEEPKVIHLRLLTNDGDE